MMCKQQLALQPYDVQDGWMDEERRDEGIKGGMKKY